jgi:hypothetical protein
MRASSLPLITLCPQAATATDIPRDTVSDAGAMGTALHMVAKEAIEKPVESAADVIPIVRHVVRLIDVDPAELEQLALTWWVGWRQIQPYMPDPMTEKYLEHGDMTGHIDILALHKEHGRIVDIKSGWKDANYQPQLKGYAWLTLQEFPHLVAVHASIHWVRSVEIEAWTWTRKDLDTWKAELAGHIATKAYNPGSPCTHCPRSLSCPGKLALVRQAAQALIDDHPLSNSYEEIELTAAQRENITDADTIRMYDQVKFLESAIQETLGVIKAIVAERGGRVVNGHEALALNETKRQELDATAAWPVLSKFVAPADLVKACKLSKGAVGEAIKKHAAAGSKGKHLAAVWAELEAAGAVRTNVSPTFQRRILPQLESKQP